MLNCHSIFYKESLEIMRRQRRTKILATLGPASGTAEKIEELFRAGADIFRINMSHTSHELLRAYVSLIRGVEQKLNRPIAILADLQGPKLRVGSFKKPPYILENNALFTLDSKDEAGDATRVYLPHPEIFESLEIGHTLLIDDGKVKLEVVETSKTHAVTKVIVGGAISNKKGVSLPDTLLTSAVMTPKDLSDLEAALNAKVDWVALSFVQRAQDVAAVKKIARGRALVMAKIEKPQAIQNIQEIMEISDALMVARGDLGVELPIARVPGLQKQITRQARRLGKPVVVATQMLESMITSPVPTRAEVSDVATAIFDGADAIMLSAESAAGQFPREAVEMMNSIAIEVEGDPTYRSVIQNQRAEPEKTGADALSAAARTIAETLDLAAIICWTFSGSTALRVARERPKPLTIAITPNMQTGRQLALVWGVHCVVTDDAHDMDDVINRACSIAKNEEFAKANERVIIVAGVPLGTPGATNMLRIAHV
jgi:pyruvate kinase